MSGLTVQKIVRLTPAMVTELQEHADAAERTLSQEIRLACRNHLAAIRADQEDQ